MLLPILVCLLIAASPLSYAVYRAWKLAELERIARSWDSMRLGRLAESIDLDRPLLPVDDDPLGLRQDEATQASLDALSQAIAASKVPLVPHDDLQPIYAIGEFEPVGWYHYEGPPPQPDFDDPQAVYPEWKPGE
jgi:hypothetical protein